MIVHPSNKIHFQTYWNTKIKTIVKNGIPPLNEAYSGKDLSSKHLFRQIILSSICRHLWQDSPLCNSLRVHPLSANSTRLLCEFTFIDISSNWRFSKHPSSCSFGGAGTFCKIAFEDAEDLFGVVKLNVFRMDETRDSRRSDLEAIFWRSEIYLGRKYTRALNAPCMGYAHATKMGKLFGKSSEMIVTTAGINAAMYARMNQMPCVVTWIDFSRVSPFLVIHMCKSEHQCEVSSSLFTKFTTWA